MKNYTKTEMGYYTLSSLPSEEYLNRHYEEKYYQGAKGAYELIYSEEEIAYFFNKLKEKKYIIDRFFGDDKPKSIIDIGCGEGWAMDFFSKLNCETKGLDFSDYGIKKFNPQQLSNFVKGDILKNMDLLRERGAKYDIVFLDHVFEHVLDPVGTLRSAKEIMKKEGMLIISVPNDFSMLQNYLLETNKVKDEYWVASPDHISYFTRKTLKKLLSSEGFTEYTAIGDYPIDTNLLNVCSNYINDKTLGKSCYFEKIEIENLLHKKQPIHKIVNYYESSIDVGLGRSFSAFFSLREPNQ